MSRRHHFRYDRQRRQVRGNFYVHGQRRLYRLCSFDEARIQGLDDQGEPIWRKRDAGWAQDYLVRRYEEVYGWLLTEADKQQARTERGRTWRELSQDWIDATRGELSPRTIEYYVRTMNEYLSVVRDHPVRAFTLHHLDRYKASLADRGLSTTSRNIRLQNIRTFLRWCYEREEIERIPPIKQIPRERKLPNTPSPEQIRALQARLERLATTERNTKRRLQYQRHLTCFLVAIGTGARAAEILHLPWANVDLDERTITIRYQLRFKPKGRKEKVVPMPAFLHQHLAAERARRPDDVWVLDNGTGRPIFHDVRPLSQAFARHYAALGLRQHRIKPMHGFRAFYATHLRNVVGADVSTIKNLLGHSDVSVTEGYFGTTRDHERQVVQALDRLTNWDNTATGTNGQDGE